MRIPCKPLLASSLVVFPLLLSPLAQAQYNGQQGNRQQYNGQQGNGQQYNGGNRHHDFTQGAYEGGRGGGYDQGQDYGRTYDNRGGYNNHGDYNNNRYQGHGIGTGKGALIGGAGGAALGAVFGGGMKGALIGGGAGAGIGAIAGHEHQQTVRRNDGYGRDGYPR